MLRTSLLFAALAALTVPVQAQQTLPFDLRFQQGQTITAVADNGSVTMTSDAIGVAAGGTLTVQYRGTSSVSINSVEILGSQDFTAAADLPVLLRQNGTTPVTVRFTPSTGTRTNARLTIGYQEGTTAARTITINVVGTAPDFAFSFTPPAGNATPLANNGNIVFPQTAIDQTVTASVAILNRGSGTGVIKSIAGNDVNPAFVLVGLPLPNTLVEPNQTVRFAIQYTPKTLDRVTGRATIELFNQQLSFTYEGTGTRDLYSYEVVRDGAPSPISPDQAITLPDTPVSEKSRVTVRFRNTGNVDGRIAAINIAGAAFSLLEAPFTPLVLAPGASASLTVEFAPRESGQAVGRLRIGNDSFDLSGRGLAPVLSYSFSAAGVTTTVQNNGSVIFAPVAVGAIGRLAFEVSNTGTASTTVNSVSLASVTAGFDLENLPSLPLQLEAGASVRFNVKFEPAVVGAATTTLRVDTATFTINATGTQPPPLPGYRFDGASGNQQPVQQPAVGLLLSQAYPLALTGKLTLTFNSDVFANDPAVQFAIGGRTIDFVIPANTTRAIFANGAQQVRLQTGTVAGNITLTPSFVTDGGINLTPTRPDFLTLTVPPSGPVLQNAALATKTANAVTLLLTGYAPTRSITQIDLRFTPVAGETVSTTQLTLNVEASFNAWYQSTASQAFGSQFSVTIPLNLAGDVNEAATLTDTVQSIAVTIGNRNGTSQSITVPVKQ
ncbi:MAG: choice-of-anchor D domain-containing protein [Bryobacteraceae bacterium]|nr:choice-of-anchor D domain-containing protein [Bryobacteraceae bacterium]